MNFLSFRTLCAWLSIVLFAFSGLHSKAADPLTAVAAGAAFKALDFDLLGLKGAVTKLDKAVQDAIASGDAALARQLRALSTIAKELVAQMEAAFARQSQATINHLDTVIAQNITDLANSIQDIESKTVEDVSRLIYQAQGSVNQILSRIPFMKNEPFIFAARTLSAPGKQSTEIEIIGYGFGLENFDAGIRVNKLFVTNDLVTIADDRAIIRLTPDMIKKIQPEGNPACNAQGKYFVEVSCNWDERRWFGKKDRKKDIKAIVDSDPLQYEISIDITFEPEVVSEDSPVKRLTMKSPEYKAKKSTILHPGGYSKNFNYEFIIPRHYNVTRWNVGLDMAYTDSSLTRIVNEPTRSADNTITVRGVVGSRDAKGTTAYATAILKLEYTEKLKKIVTKPSHSSKTVMRNSGRSTFSIPKGSGINKIVGQIRFLGCPETLDAFELHSPGSSANENTRNGLFAVSLRGNQLAIIDTSGRRH